MEAKATRTVVRGSWACFCKRDVLVVVGAFIPLADNHKDRKIENQGIIHTISVQIHMEYILYM